MLAVAHQYDAAEVLVYLLHFLYMHIVQLVDSVHKGHVATQAEPAVAVHDSRLVGPRNPNAVMPIVRADGDVAAGVDLVDCNHDVFVINRLINRSLLSLNKFQLSVFPVQVMELTVTQYRVIYLFVGVFRKLFRYLWYDQVSLDESQHFVSI